LNFTAVRDVLCFSDTFLTILVCFTKKNLAPLDARIMEITNQAKERKLNLLHYVGIMKKIMQPSCSRLSAKKS
jgi:hypothetical protein